MVVAVLDQLERGGKVSFSAARHRHVWMLIVLVLLTALLLMVAVTVVVMSGGLQTAVREPGFWAALVVALAAGAASVTAVSGVRARERLVITQGGFFTEVRRVGPRTRGDSVRWVDVDEIWIRWFGAFRPSSATLLACYTLTPEAELSARRALGPRREAMRRSDSFAGVEVHSLPQQFGRQQLEVLEIMRRAHQLYGPNAVAGQEQALTPN